MPERPSLSFTQIQAAMQAMIEKAMQLPEEPVAMAIVDATGNLLAYNTMDNLRLYSRRHALRKAYTAAILGMDTGAHAQSGCTARGAASARWAIPSSRSDREAWS
jgi:glc operon protein GlcG